MLSLSESFSCVFMTLMYVHMLAIQREYRKLIEIEAPSHYSRMRVAFFFVYTTKFIRRKCTRFFFVQLWPCKWTILFSFHCISLYKTKSFHIRHKWNVRLLEMLNGSESAKEQERQQENSRKYEEMLMQVLIKNH